jgi:tripartite ATP-independent transporter DctP family solute receptor
MMLKKFRCLALVMALILVIVSSTTFAAKKPIKVVYGHVYSVNEFLYKGDLYFKKLVEKNSKGQILVEVFPQGQLGSQVEMIQATRSGAQQMFLSSIGALETIWPKLATFDLYYIFRNQKHFLKVIKTIPTLIDQNELAAKTGLRILNVRPNLPRHMTSNFPINKLEDINGIKMRSPESASAMAQWKAMGTIPTVIPFTDVYTALATGTVVAQENPLPSIYSMKFYEVQKYCALTAHQRVLTAIFINNNFWKRLTKKQQKIMTDAATKCAQKGIKDAQSEEDKYYKILVNKGMKFTRPDVAPFREKVKSVWRQMGDQRLLEKIQAVK